MISIEQILSHTEALPASPEILPRLQRLLHDSETTMSEVVELFELDPNLTAQLIRISNSAYYGSAQSCKSVEDAIQRVGFDEVYKLVATITSLELIGDELPLYELSAQEHWLYSLRCANLMKQLATVLRLDEDDAYTIGLLHSLGKVVIDRYHQLKGLDDISSHDTPLTHRSEKRLLGFDHAELTAALLDKWHFDTAISEPVRHQYDHKDNVESLRMAVLLHLCRDAQHCMSETPERIAEAVNVNPEHLTYLGLSEDELIDATLDAQNAVEWLTNTL